MDIYKLYFFSKCFETFKNSPRLKKAVVVFLAVMAGVGFVAALYKWKTKKVVIHKRPILAPVVAAVHAAAAPVITPAKALPLPKPPKERNDSFEKFNDVTKALKPLILDFLIPKDLVAFGNVSRSSKELKDLCFFNHKRKFNVIKVFTETFDTNKFTSALKYLLLNSNFEKTIENNEGFKTLFFDRICNRDHTAFNHLQYDVKFCKALKNVFINYATKEQFENFCKRQAFRSDYNLNNFTHPELVKLFADPDLFENPRITELGIHLHDFLNELVPYFISKHKNLRPLELYEEVIALYLSRPNYRCWEMIKNGHYSREWKSCLVVFELIKLPKKIPKNDLDLQMKNIIGGEINVGMTLELLKPHLNNILDKHLTVIMKHLLKQYKIRPNCIEDLITSGIQGMLDLKNEKVTKALFSGLFMLINQPLFHHLYLNQTYKPNFSAFLGLQHIITTLNPEQGDLLISQTPLHLRMMVRELIRCKEGLNHKLYAEIVDNYIEKIVHVRPYEAERIKAEVEQRNGENYRRCYEFARYLSKLNTEEKLSKVLDFFIHNGLDYKVLIGGIRMNGLITIPQLGPEQRERVFRTRGIPYEGDPIPPEQLPKIIDVWKLPKLDEEEQKVNNPHKFKHLEKLTTQQ